MGITGLLSARFYKDLAIQTSCFPLYQLKRNKRQHKKKKKELFGESFSLPPPSATKANSRSLCASHAHPGLLTGCLTRQTLILDTTLISWDQTARRCAPQVPRSAEIAPFHKSYVIASLISATESSWMWSLFPKFHILALQTYISYLKNTF